MVNKKFISFQLLIAIFAILFLSSEREHSTVYAFILMLPAWACIAYAGLPKDRETWKQKWLFLTFFGHGISILVFVIMVVGMAFISAITGLPLEGIYLYLFIPALIIALFCGGLFFDKELSRIQQFGLDYIEHITDQEQTMINNEYASMDEVLKKLTILNLDPDVTMKSLKDRYHQLCFLYHPDRLESMSEPQRELASAEFQRIQNAYEMIKKQIELGKL